MKIQRALIVCLTLILVGCGQSNEHAIFRSGDMITIYLIFRYKTQSFRFGM